MHVYIHTYLCSQNSVCHKDTPPILYYFVVVTGGIAGGGGGGGWGFAGMQQQQPMAPSYPQQQNYEAMFNSLFPINGMVTGTYV